MQGAYLQVEANVGINCHSKNCMVIHPSEMYMIYAAGSLLVVKSVDDSKDKYLKGHNGKIHCIQVSTHGELMASGEVHDQRSDDAAALIVWDFASLEIMYRVRYHKQMVQAMSFNCDERLLVSVGGVRDGCQLVVWNMSEGKSEVFMPASD